MFDVLGVISYLVFGAWFIASALNQSERTRKWVKLITAYDVCGLIPLWTFFAPNPGTNDTHFLYRDVDGWGNPGAWVDVSKSFCRGSRVWNPKRRVLKGITDLNRFYVPYSKEDNHLSRQVLVSFPYILLLHFIDRLPRMKIVAYRQFALASSPSENLRSSAALSFVSSVHRLH